MVGTGVEVLEVEKESSLFLFATCECDLLIEVRSCLSMQDCSLQLSMTLPGSEWYSIDLPPSKNVTTLWVALEPGAVNAVAATLDCAMIPPVPVCTHGTATLPVADDDDPFPPACPVVSTGGDTGLLLWGCISSLGG
eukprot:9416768-Karenia_brevis.AAC.1